MTITPDYNKYNAKPINRKHSALHKGVWNLIRTKVLYDRLLLPYALFRHKRLTEKSEKVNDHTYTCFLRAPSQLELLAGPVMDFLSPDGRLEITLLACSNGAETYTIASWLRKQRPDLDFHIHASDLHEGMVERAKAGEYSRDEVLHCEYMTPEFLDATFEERGERFVVRPEIRQHTSFSCANLLDGDALRDAFGQSPLVIAQNVLFHLTPSDATRAFDNLVSLMTARGALMIEGMQLDLRVELTKRYSLKPFKQNQRRIYEETRVHTPPHWWRVYWGTEPYLSFRKDVDRRYGTVFMRDSKEALAVSD